MRARIAARGRPGGRPARRGPRERRARLSLPCPGGGHRGLGRCWCQPGGSLEAHPLRRAVAIYCCRPGSPVAHAFSFMHATDRRPFVFPWEGATAVGTTDLDHRDGLGEDARDQPAPNSTTCWRPAPSSFPPLPSRRATCCRPGRRATGGQQRRRQRKPLTRNASMCSGAKGCVTLAGGKLTTFRPLAVEVLQACAPLLGRTVTTMARRSAREGPAYRRPGQRQRCRLAGRYGRDLVRPSGWWTPSGNDCVGASETLWAELAFAAEAEMVLHLDDLLSRRTCLACCVWRRRGIPAANPRTLAKRAWAGTTRAGNVSNRPIWTSGAGTTACPPDQPRRERDERQELSAGDDNGTQSVRALLFDLQGNLLGKGKVELGGLLLEASGLGLNRTPSTTGRCSARPARRSGTRWTSIVAHPRGVADHPARYGDPRRCRGVPPLRPAILWLDRAGRRSASASGGRGWLSAGRRRGRGGAFPRPGRGQLGGPGAAGDRREDRQGVAAFRLLSHRLTGRFVDSVGCCVAYLPFVLQAPALGPRRATGNGRRWRYAASSCRSCSSWRAARRDQRRGQPAHRHSARPAVDRRGGRQGLRGARRRCAGACHIACLSYGTMATINTTRARYLETVPLILPPYPAAIPDHFNTGGDDLSRLLDGQLVQARVRLARDAAGASRGRAEQLFDELVNGVPPGSMGLTLQPYWSPNPRTGTGGQGVAMIGFRRRAYPGAHLPGHPRAAWPMPCARASWSRSCFPGIAGIVRLRVAGAARRATRRCSHRRHLACWPSARMSTRRPCGDRLRGGAWPHPDVASAVAGMTRVGRVFLPQAEARQIYQRFYGEVYLRMYRQLRPLYRSIREITVGYPA